MQSRHNITGNTAISLPFPAKQIIALNPMGRAIYVRIGALDYPTAGNADFIVPPATYLAIPLPDVKTLAVAVGAAVVPSTLGTRATFVFNERIEDTGIANVNLPQVLTSPQFLRYKATLPASGATFTVLTPPAGQAILLYQMWGSVASTAGRLVLYFVRRSNDLQEIATWNSAATPNTEVDHYISFPPYTFAPNGLLLPVGASITITNGAAVAMSYMFFQAVYTFV